MTPLLKAAVADVGSVWHLNSALPVAAGTPHILWKKTGAAAFRRKFALAVGTHFSSISSWAAGATLAGGSGSQNSKRTADSD